VLRTYADLSMLYNFKKNKHCRTEFIGLHASFHKERDILYQISVSVSRSNFIKNVLVLFILVSA
jgi:hypothetical protein